MIDFAIHFMLAIARFLFWRTRFFTLGFLPLTVCSHLYGTTDIYTVTNLADTGSGSLRTAILNANAAGASSTNFIHFNIVGPGPFTISPTAALPPITARVTIDGTTQPGYAGKPSIELDGTSAGNDTSGLYLQSSNCVVRGLAINRFGKEGIRIEGSGSNVIQGNFIGTGPFGTNSLGNGTGSGAFGGITILSAGNLIGGTDPTNRNIISGNNPAGIWVVDAGNGAARGNQIVGNFIGLDVTGTNRLGNTENGIATYGDRNTIIGGTNVNARNVISGNYQSGLYLKSDLFLGINSSSNVILGNFIGTDVSGTKVISNSSDGITLAGATYTMIGGTTAATRNVISGNGGRGIHIDAHGATGNVIQGNFIGTDCNGTARMGNAFAGVEILSSSNNIVGGAVAGAGNVISANGLSGMSLSSSESTGNVVQGNYIGTDVTGTNALGNVRGGVYATNVTGNLIGGEVAGAGNIISGNLDNGIWLDANARSNQIKGNLIGSDSTGARRLGNGSSGVRIFAASSNLVGGTISAARNLISGNTNSGLFFSGAAASNNLVQGNYIGTTVNGTSALPNGYAGAGLDGAPGNWIGGSIAAGARNVISGNTQNGIYLINGAVGNVVQGNLIGTDASGTARLGNGWCGVEIGSSNNIIGGSWNDERNVISGNYQDGIRLGNAGPGNGNVIKGNFIGTRNDGTNALGNTNHGIEIVNTASNNIVGSSNLGEFNTIAFATSSAFDGVRAHDSCRRNLVLGNSIYSNGGSSTKGLGIDIGVDGVTPNDACDGDDGPNALQNYPVLTAAFSGGVTTVRGSLNSVPNSTYLLQFYANSIVEPSGYGEGQTYLGSAAVNSGADCSLDFVVTLPIPATIGQRLSATATDAANNTSEFSATVVVQPQPILSLTYSNAPASVTLAWANSATGFVLQQATNLTHPIEWSDVTNTPVDLGGQFSVMLTPGTGNRFYRLVLP